MSGGWRARLYAAACVLALALLAYNNARGYTPFATVSSRGPGGGTANHFHK